VKSDQDVLVTGFITPPLTVVLQLKLGQPTALPPASLQVAVNLSGVPTETLGELGLKVQEAGDPATIFSVL